MAKTSYIRKKKGLKENLPRFFLLIALVIFAMIFQGMQSKFLSMNNVMNLLAISSITGVLALGNMLLMSAGEMSFSLGAQCTVIGGVFGSYLAGAEGRSIFVAFLLAVGASLLIGAAIAAVLTQLITNFLCLYAMKDVEENAKLIADAILLKGVFNRRDSHV